MPRLSALVCPACEWGWQGLNEQRAENREQREKSRASRASREHGVYQELVHLHYEILVCCSHHILIEEFISIIEFIAWWWQWCLLG
jgi:hypothetical protein